MCLMTCVCALVCVLRHLYYTLLTLGTQQVVSDLRDHEGLLNSERDHNSQQLLQVQRALAESRAQVSQLKEVSYPLTKCYSLVYSQLTLYAQRLEIVLL